MGTGTVGNYNLITSDEEKLVKYLRQRNLENVNTSDEKVFPVDSFYVRYGKRILDLAISIPAFIITLPLNVIFGICTFFDVGRPIIFKQSRVGKGGTTFIIKKFRNMNEKKDDNGRLLPPSQRVTRFGKFMRKYSLDELLNFWSVIKGDMSIIGPRPLPLVFTERMSNRHKMRTLLRPGLECPRVLEHNEEHSLYETQFENDIWYIENISLFTDIKMLFRLFCMTFDSKYRSKSAEGASYFVGYDENNRATSFKKYIEDHPGIMDQL